MLDNLSKCICALYKTLNSFLSRVDLTLYKYATYGYILSVTFLFTISLCFAYVDIYNKPECIVKRKINKKKVPPSDIKKAFGVVFKRTVVDAPLNLALIYGTIYVGNVYHGVMPSVPYILLDFVLRFIITDIYFYTAHRIVHKWFYNTVHKTHHYFKTPVAISSLYCERTEMLFVNLMALQVPSMILRSHIYLIILWTIIGVVNTTVVHSGYNLISPINSVTHNRHHEFFNVNYGAGSIVDALMGTRYEDIYEKKSLSSKLNKCKLSNWRDKIVNWWQENRLHN